MRAKLPQSCLILCHSVDCDPPGSSVHGISQARILELVAMPFSRDSSDSELEPESPALASRVFTTSTTREAHGLLGGILNIFFWGGRSLEILVL